MTEPSHQPTFGILASPGFADWLAGMPASLALSTYQIGKVFFIGVRDGQRISAFERTFNRCMGLWTDTDTLWLASAFQLWRFHNVLPPATHTDDGFDRLFVPQAAFTTGDIDVHDVSVDEAGAPVFVNTLFSCLGRVGHRFSFDVVWKPPFITQLTAEDRCHLNGLCCQSGRPRYVTACAGTDTRHAWRESRGHGGCVIDLDDDRIVLTGLSMPHSPRLHRGRLWLLDSGSGYFGSADLRAENFQPLVFCPGYARGLCFVDKYAVVGLSKPRHDTFAGLALDKELVRHNRQPFCGLQVIDLDRAAVVHWLRFEGVVEELYDVVVLPGVRRPKALGMKTDEIRRNVWFEQEGRITRWSAAEGS